MNAVMRFSRVSIDIAITANTCTAANVLIGAVALHVIGAIVESVRHRENLPLAMVTGYKRAPTGTDIDHAPAPD